MSLTSYRAAPSRDTLCDLPLTLLEVFVGLLLTLLEAGVGHSDIVLERCGLLLGLAVTYSPGA